MVDISEVLKANTHLKHVYQSWFQNALLQGRRRQVV
jgi:hypothetical protein